MPVTAIHHQYTPHHDDCETAREQKENHLHSKRERERVFRFNPHSVYSFVVVKRSFSRDFSNDFVLPCKSTLFDSDSDFYRSFWDSKVRVG